MQTCLCLKEAEAVHGSLWFHLPSKINVGTVEGMLLCWRSDCCVMAKQAQGKKGGGGGGGGDKLKMKGSRMSTETHLSSLPLHKLTTERASTRVVVVVVRERFSLVMSAIYVQITGHAHRSEVTRTVYHMAQVFVCCCVLTTVDL